MAKRFFPGTLWVTKKYEIEEFALRVPKDDKDRETDIYNSILLYEHLRHLPLYVLTDERFWCWINFEIGYEVALKYMPVKKGSSVFKDHWLLTQGKRRGLFLEFSLVATSVLHCPLMKHSMILMNSQNLLLKILCDSEN